MSYLIVFRVNHLKSAILKSRQKNERKRYLKSAFIFVSHKSNDDF